MAVPQMQEVSRELETITTIKMKSRISVIKMTLYLSGFSNRLRVNLWIDKLKVSNPKEENRSKKGTDPRRPVGRQVSQHKCNGSPRR